MEMILNGNFNVIGNNELDIINGGSPFGFMSGAFAAGAGACAIGGRVGVGCYNWRRNRRYWWIYSCI